MLMGAFGMRCAGGNNYYNFSACPFPNPLLIFAVCR
jgi:hypothetical protein